MLLLSSVNLANVAAQQCRKGGRDIPETSEAPAQRVTASGAALYMNNIMEEDGGIYIVTAENKIGRSRKSFRVNVEFPPR